MPEMEAVGKQRLWPVAERPLRNFGPPPHGWRVLHQDLSDDASFAALTENGFFSLAPGGAARYKSPGGRGERTVKSVFENVFKLHGLSAFHSIRSHFETRKNQSKSLKE
jgi:hypothetical protein